MPQQEKHFTARRVDAQFEQFAQAAPSTSDTANLHVIESLQTIYSEQIQQEQQSIERMRLRLSLSVAASQQEKPEVTGESTAADVLVQTFSDNNQIPGGDPAALNMVVSGELDFFTLNGGSIGNLVPASNVQGILFAFRNPAQVFGALDGDLGDYLREEMKTKGLYAVPRGCFDNGFHQITCSTRPIRTVDDLQGLKIRTPDAPIYVEAWKALGAAPVVANLNKLYETLKNGTAEAQTNPLATAEFLKLYEVQKYVSLTNHGWSGFNLLANWKLWQRFPADVQQVIERNAMKFARLQRADHDTLNIEFRTKLAQQGMTFNEADTSSFRPKLTAYYARWKETVGSRAWSLLEGHVGKLA